jgi:flagellar hook-associated protein 3 FlgL
MRLGTANTYDNTLANLTTRQSDLADLQEKLSAGKKVVRASDDPTGAAQAERALTRSARIDTEQRVLAVQKNSISMAESTLGDATGLLQSIRDLVIGAGNGSYNSVNRSSIAEQMRQLREELASYANKQDSNGVPLFGGLGSLGAPFSDIVAGKGFNGVTYSGLPGQKASTTVSIPSTMDGQATWMDVPTGNGVFKVGLGSSTAIPATTNTGSATADIGQVITPAAVTGHNYSINFSVAAGVTTYNVFDDTLDPTHAAAPLLANQPYVSTQSIQFDGLSFTPHGTPANGDVLSIMPPVQNTGSVTTDVGQVITPTAITGHYYSAVFNVTGGVSTYNVFDDTLDPKHAAAPMLANQPYTDGQSIQFGGMSFATHGTPVSGDTLRISPSVKSSLFSVLDAAIASIDGAGNSAPLTQALAYATTEIDAGMARIQATRGFAGDLLNRADNIDTQQQAKTVQLAADRSRAEDMDMVKGISEFQNRQTAYDAALRTYAQVQKLSLFNYLG